MPKKKKAPRDLTTEEIAKEVFPKKVIEAVKEITHPPDKPKGKDSSHT